MTKATITRQGKGWKLSFEDGKSLPISWTNIPSDWEGAEVLVEREKGQPVQIQKGAQMIKKPTAPQTTNTHDMKKQHGGNNNKNHQGSYAYPNREKGNAYNTNSDLPKTPYNFVPLNEQVVIPPDMCSFSTFEGLSGSIEVRITNKTDMFIRGNKTDCLYINGKAILPGASWRGLIRNMVEMISYGKFVTFTDKRLYARKYGATAANGRKLGFLKYEGDAGFKIYEANSMPAVLGKTYPEFKYQFNGSEVEIYTGKIRANENFKIQYATSGKSYTVSNSLIKSYQEDETRGTENEMKDLVELAKKEKLKNKVPKGLSYIGVPVWYLSKGSEIEHFGHCKNYRVPAPSSIEGHVPQVLRNEKEHDFAERIFGTDQDEMIASRVFFEDLTCTNATFHENESVLKILSSPKPTSYQLYLTQEDDHVSASQQNTWLTSPAATIRGYKQYWHRVTQDLSQEKSVKSYSEVFSVKEDDFKKYLKKIAKKDENGFIAQLGDKVTKEGEKLIFKKGLTSITDSSMRQVVIDYFFLDKENMDITGPQNTIIRALKPENTFTGRIRFENLSEEALGALLFALALPQDCCHKIGMGKPLGLGTIHIEVTKLHVHDRKARYASLLSNDGMWLQPSTTYEVQALKNTFEKYVQNAINDSSPLWKNQRLKHLKAMLEFNPQFHSEEKKWLERTRYMQIDPQNEFKRREILKMPRTIKPI